MTQSKPIVSVIIPTIRFDEHCNDAIESVIAQSIPGWEIVLVLDGAPRSSVPQAIIADPRIEIVENSERLGTPRSLNRGAEASTGMYIARLDADDLAYPRRLECQVDYLQRNDDVVCFGTAVDLIDNHGLKIRSGALSTASSDLRHTLLVRNPLVHSTVMYRREAFESVGGYSTVMKRMQDYELYLRLARAGRIARTDEVLGAYRVHPGQHSRQTAAFSDYTELLLTQRLALAEFLEESRLRQHIRNRTWQIAQASRHLGIRKPRYLSQAVSRVAEGADSKPTETRND